MKKIFLLSAISASLFVFGCKTQINVESAASNMAVYQMGELTGKINGSVAKVFAAASATLDDLGYMRTGEITKNPLQNKIRARMPDDRRVDVSIKDIGNNMVEVSVSVSDSELYVCQSIFNAIASKCRDSGVY